MNIFRIRVMLKNNPKIYEDTWVLSEGYKEVLMDTFRYMRQRDRYRQCRIVIKKLYELNKEVLMDTLD